MTELPDASEYGPFDGTLPLIDGSAFPIPERYQSETTMRTWGATVVFHSSMSSRSRYDPKDGQADRLHPEEGVFIVEFQPHGAEDVEARFRLVPSEHYERSDR